MMAKVTYSVSRVVPADVRGELGKLWSRNLHVEGGVDQKFDWLYRDAPDCPDSVFLLAAGDAAERTFVGTAGVGLRRLWVHGSERRTGLLADLAVDREHRTVMPALALVRAVKEWALRELDVVYGFPNQHAEGVFKRVGYKPLGTIGRWARVLRHASYAARVPQAAMPRVPMSVRRMVDRAAQVPAIAALAGGAFDAFKLAQMTPSAVQAARQIKLSWLDEADERIDQLWESARDGFEIVGVRSARFLRWRFPAGERVRIALATSRADGAPRAYAVIEQVDKVAHVRDLFGHRDSVCALLDLLMPALYPRGAASISVRYLGARWLVQALEERGFVERDSHRLIAVGVRDGVEAEMRGAIESVASWHMTDADEDT